MPLIIDYAFDHLRQGSNEPFDFGYCRQKAAIPDSVELYFAEYLGLCLKGLTEEKFDAVAAVLGSAILKSAIFAKGKTPPADVILQPTGVFDKDIQSVCKIAIDRFLSEGVQCSYVDPVTGDRCVNTKAGHIKGHQRSSGAFLKEGVFVSGDLGKAEDTVVSIMTTIKAKVHSNRQEWRVLVAKHHRANIENLRKLGGYPSPNNKQGVDDQAKKRNDKFASTSVCYGCLVGKPEYRLPCQHVICENCLRDNDPTAPGIGKGTYVHNDCIVCGESGHPEWPFSVQIRPELSGIRVLSLDGGGVRGIVELVILERLEDLIGLGLPIGTFFDLIIGTSTGGLVAMGIGIQKLTAKECTSKFRSICRDGFDHKFLTKTWVVGWVARWCRDSIYVEEALEKALQEAFSDPPATQVFGMKDPCRVAVTTTVGTDGAPGVRMSRRRPQTKQPPSDGSHRV
ncbi:hypothetical protein AOL_s00140g77 [Orbilia oligospora ATCC 24927]|uniref:PNPLA domain-containing protein n=1 Tax=Arthrobotrys oligospora (strain ATCC 24927 / CBS 115.81 / DSM 1491) TaxID=756982 RepID=G1XMA8_ARTOA|nr:hypothetical protein AOL_s00140g77 [Orbilia oligospora ATCC 24927]EGX45761.1 hypothetical protein AOL_s00140g77 [Orbilia oligospora ATCC 24927]